MRWALGLLGITLLAVMAWDVFATALGRGGGPVFMRLISAGWRLAARFSIRTGWQRLLGSGGVLAFLLTILAWLVASWLGWWLVFSAAERAVIVQATLAPATLLERLEYVGNIMLTLTRADFAPEGTLWMIASLIATANGFMLITLSMTYVLTTLQAAGQKRQLAGYVTSISGTAEEWICQGWNGRDLHSLDTHLSALAPMIIQMSENHLSFPAVRFFHSTQRSSAIAPALACLDEALTVLRYAVPPQHRPDPIALRSARRAVSNHLQTLRDVSIRPGDASPLPPHLDRLRAEGIPLLPETEFRVALDELDERRRLLHALVTADGWTWSDVQIEPQPEGQSEREPTESGSDAQGSP